jgi:streptogramin lyase
LIEVGATFAGYRIEGCIGRGGMGVVYQATHLRLERTVALKLIAPELAEDSGFRMRFESESRMAAAIDHPNVIPIYEAGDDQGTLFIAMRYVDGSDLKELLARDSGISPLAAAGIVDQIAMALGAAHARGLVHRDVKPANVLLAGPRGRPHAYLTDFGLTKRSASEGGLTRTGSWVGTLDYVAPEQLRGDPIDGRTDVYSLGCVLYETLTGEVPYPRNNDVAKLYAHLHDPAPLPSERSLVSVGDFDEVVARALQKDPSDRFGSAAEFESAVRTVVERRTRLQAGSRGETRVPRTRGRRPALPVSRPGSLAALAALIVVVVVAALATGVFSGGGQEGGSGTSAGKIVGPPIPVGRGADAMALGLGGLWVANSQSETVNRIDPSRSTIEGNPTVVNSPDAVAVGQGYVWVIGLDNTVTRLDRTGIVRGKPIGTPSNPQYQHAAVVGNGALWVAGLDHNPTVTRIDPGSGKRFGAPIPTGTPAVITAIAAGGGYIWVTTDDGALGRIDPRSNNFVERPVQVTGGTPTAVAFGEGAVWVTDGRLDTVTKIDPRTARRVGAPIPTGRLPLALGVGNGSVWVATSDDKTIVRIDPDARRLVGKPISLGAEPGDIAVSEGAVWVSLPGRSAVRRIDPSP